MKVSTFTKLSFLILFSTILISQPAEAQLFGKKKKKKEAEAGAAKKPEKKKDKYEEAIKSSNAIEGLFTLYQDSVKGDLKMAITADQLEKKFIHFYYIENGVTEAGSFRGNYRGSRVFQITKYFDRLEFAIVNTSYYFDPENAISKAAEANMSDAVIFSADIKATAKNDSAYLIEVDKLFLSETLGVVKLIQTKPRPNAFNPGSLSKDKTKYASIRNYPENTDIIVDYVYQNSSPKNWGSDAVADARSTTITVQHSLIAVPENDFEPRFDDPRVGYFMTKVTDLTSPSSTPYRDVIHRWHLKKKYPDSAISEPVEPITYWIENTTPEELRPTIMKAAMKWNIAFEKAGFKNAFVVKVQPDTADWDAGDIRYNVLRWTSSPNPPFGGYGPSFVNPMTGQILGADIMLEYATMFSRYRLDWAFAQGSDLSELEEHFDEKACHAGAFTCMQNAFGMTAVDLLDDAEEEKPEIVEDWTYYLILHEIGHTLGLNHNMKASQLHSLKDIHNAELTSRVGTMGSVMDYPSINFNKDRDAQGEYYITTPGPYDLWAIEFGYKEAGEDEIKEILKRSTEPALTFGNDADDMRSPGKAIDPRVNIYDLTSDAIEYAIERVDLSEMLVKELLDKYLDTREDVSYQELRNAYMNATGQLYQSASTISRYIGGVYVERGYVGQEGAIKPYTPVEEAKQKQAMSALNKYFFAPGAFAGEKDIYNYLQSQRRGFDHYRRGEDPKLHDRFLSIQRGILSHLLHQNVLNRIVDSELYGNSYELDEMMTDLHNGIFGADAYGSVNSMRQNLQTEYVMRLISIVDRKSGSYLPNVRSMAFYNLQQARAVASRKTGDTATRAHRAHLVYLIDEALEN